MAKGLIDQLLYIFDWFGIMGILQKFLVAKGLIDQLLLIFDWFLSDQNSLAKGDRRRGRDGIIPTATSGEAMSGRISSEITCGKGIVRLAVAYF